MSNHVAALDDPLVTAALLPPGALLHARQLRWTLCATDRSFTSATATVFFRAAKARAFPPLGTLSSAPCKPACPANAPRCYP